MNEIITNILSRRSVRDFSQKPILKTDLEILIKAGMYAPSGMNKQTWKFTGILNSACIKELAQAVGKVIGNEGYNFYSPTALIIVSNDKNSRWGKEDNSCALQNIFLAAHSKGIGSVWINQLNEGNCDKAEIRKVLDKLGVPKDHSVYGVAALGYSSSEPRGIVDKTGDYTIIE